MTYSIGEFSAVSNLSIDTLRYYEKELLIIAKRDAAGRRRYTEADIEWIQFIKRLKETGMSIKDIKQYAVLRYEGDSTLHARLEMLEKHRLFVIAEKAKWECNLKNLEKKIEIYKGKITELELK